MPRPISTSQIERLGLRLVRAAPPANEDLELLHELLAAYSEVLEGAVERVRVGLSIAPTSRIKNTGTILEKLQRYGGSWLKSIHDLAGMRIVQSFDRRGQDALIAQLVELFANQAPGPRISTAELDAMPATTRKLLSAQAGLHGTVVEQAILVADLIDAVEQIEACTPDDPELIDRRRRVETELADLRTTLDDLSALTEQLQPLGFPAE